jgi:hypothetical protein
VTQEQLIIVRERLRILYLVCHIRGGIIVASSSFFLTYPATYANSSSKGLLTTISRFASEEFWLGFAAMSAEEFPPTEAPKVGATASSNISVALFFHRSTILRPCKRGESDRCALCDLALRRGI